MAGSGRSQTAFPGHKASNLEGGPGPSRTLAGPYRQRPVRTGLAAVRFHAWAAYLTRSPSPRSWWGLTGGACASLPGRNLPIRRPTRRSAPTSAKTPPSSRWPVRQALDADRFDESYAAGSRLGEQEAVAAVRDRRGASSAVPW